VQHYVELLRPLPIWERERIRVVDAGCGKAYMSLALVATVLGAYDVNEKTAVKSGWSAVAFGTVADDEPVSVTATTAAARSRRLTARPARASAAPAPRARHPRRGPET